jgi:predicted DNA-binding transcriptional regulator YafY
MQRFDRILGILLFLRSGQLVSASALARHFAVSTRTIYRDVEVLSALGVPVYAERGREGGFRLLEGYFLPPLMFTQGEAIALLVGLTLQRSLQATPFPTERELAEKKLLAALPDRLRAILAKAEKLIGFEPLPHDIFHPERAFPQPAATASLASAASTESQAISIFLQAILDGTLALMRYHSPYSAQPYDTLVEPLGLFWDRDHWYLAGKEVERQRPVRLWRADRVIEIRPRQPAFPLQTAFDVRDLLGRSWLQEAMEAWRQRVPVKIHLNAAQAERLQQDWYYHHAVFEPTTDGQVVMTFGESDPAIVLELLRWLGPGATLLEPAAWREQMRQDLQQMLAAYMPAD